MNIYFSYIMDIEETSLRAISNLEKSKSEEDPYLYIATHPILIYRMIRRFAQDLQPISSIVWDKDDMFGEWLYELLDQDKLSEFPTITDLEDALALISRIQVANHLNTSEV